MSDETFEQRLERLKSNWVFSYELGAFVYVGDESRYPPFYMLSKEQFNDHYADEFPGRGRKSPVRAMLTHGCRQVARLAYLPGNPKRLTTESVDGFTMPVVNQWSGCRVPEKFIKEGDIRRYLDHVAYVIPNAKPRAYITDTFATWVRKPGAKTNVVIMILGLSGLGKDLCLFPVGQALGETNYRVATPDDLLSPYTDWMNHVKLANIDLQEIDHPRQVLRKITPFVASPPTRLRIHGKFIPHYEIANLIQFVITRHTMDGLSIPEGDRRFYPYHSPATPRSREYYAELWDWIKTPRNLGAVIHYYQHEHEIADSFNPLTPPPTSKTKDALIEASKSNLQQYLEAASADRRAPLRHPLVTLDELLRHFDLHVTAFKGVSLHDLGSTLAKIGGRKLGQIHLADGEHRRLWAVGPEAAEWADKPAAVLRAQYERQRGGRMLRIKALRAVVKRAKRA
jgi:hypothetical protein